MLQKLLQCLVLVILVQTPLQAYAQFKPCAFDSLQFGWLERISHIGSGIEITLDAEIESYTHTVGKHAPFYHIVEEILLTATNSSEPLGIAFLYTNNTLCGITEANVDYVYVQRVQKRNSNYIISVATNETDNEYTLKISPQNGLYNEAEKLLRPLIHNIAYVIFSSKNEILEINLYQ